MKKKVLIAMSGGVDSSAAALLLQKQGYECAGATLSLCGNETDGAKRIADGLGMPVLHLRRARAFCARGDGSLRQRVPRGRTPNPCIDCNRCLKFGAFLDRALEMGFDYIATGHYARVGYDEASGRYRLLRGESRAKDQSYVLYQLTQEQLSHRCCRSAALKSRKFESRRRRRALQTPIRPIHRTSVSSQTGTMCAFCATMAA